MTDDEKLELLRNGTSQGEVARRAGCSKDTIHRFAVRHGVNFHKQRWSRESVAVAVADSKSKHETCTRLGLSSGSSQSTLNKYLKLYGISTTHFTTAAERLDAVRPLSVAPERVLVYGSSSGRSTIKRVLARIGFPCRCSCGLTDTWKGKKLQLQLDHIDGDGRNNELGNLRWLCPNCHSQTETFAGKNTRQQRQKPPVEPRSQKSTESKPRPSKIKWPTSDELKEMVTTMPTSTVASLLGVSDVAVAKRCRKLGIAKPSRGYWARHK